MLSGYHNIYNYNIRLYLNTNIPMQCIELKISNNIYNLRVRVYVRTTCRHTVRLKNRAYTATHVDATNHANRIDYFLFSSSARKLTEVF